MKAALSGVCPICGADTSHGQQEPTGADLDLLSETARAKGFAEGWQCARIDAPPDEIREALMLAGFSDALVALASGPSAVSGGEAR